MRGETVKERITLGMNLIETIMAMSDGNPGAATVIVSITKQAAAIDPDDAFGWLGVLSDLDDRGIYGSRIWQLYKNVCHEDLSIMLAILRADQLGQLAGVNAATIEYAIDHDGEGIDIPAVIAAVQERLPNFAITMKAMES